MIILADTREQIPLWDHSKKNISFEKLDEGDYTTPTLKNHLVIERKSPADLYGTLTGGHQRFKKEILRCEEKNKQMIILVECNRDEFYSCNWMPPQLKFKKKRTSMSTIRKMIQTMDSKYEHISFVFVENRQRAREYIVHQFIMSEAELSKTI